MMPPVAVSLEEESLEEESLEEVGETDPSLDQQTMQEIERLRSEIEQFLKTVPESLRAKVRAMLLEAAQQRPEASPEVAEQPSVVTPPAEVLPAEDVPLAEEPSTATLPPHQVRTVETQPQTEPADSMVTAPATTLPATTTRSINTETPSAPKTGRPPRLVCNSLDVFDENGDGKITGLDRYWRFLYVWVDANRDGQAQEKEVESAYAAGVRELGVRLNVFYRKKGGLGEIRIRESILLDLAGNGFGESRRPDDGVLMVDADALGRGDGPKVIDASGTRVSGRAAFAAGWRFQLADGSELAIRCP